MNGRDWSPYTKRSYHYYLQKLKQLFNVKIKIYKKLTIKLWMLLIMISITICSLFLTQSTRPKPLVLDLSQLDDLPFDERYDDKTLKKFPISERPVGSKIDNVFQYGCRDPLIEATKPRANAAFVVLARNSEIDGVILSMRSLERRFNQWFNYPWIFLNDVKFTKDFKERVLEVASGKVKFGLIPARKWKFNEEYNDPIFFNEAIESQGDREIMYGNMPSYHSMCRFYSGYFFEHPMVKKLDWYWRVEPEVDFYCDLTYDPFIEMEKHGKKYGYTIAIKELVNTIPNLFRYTKGFIREENIELTDAWNFFATNHRFYSGANEEHYYDTRNKDELIKKVLKRTSLNSALKKLENIDDPTFDPNQIGRTLLNALVNHSNKKGLLQASHEQYNGEEYNLCHFWSNFEIASNSLFTSSEYKKYYDFLEKSHGFFTERWGDAPIHSLAAGMFLNLDEIHYFRDIGYKHSTLGHCPYNSPNQLPYKEGPNFKKQVLPEDERYYADYDPPVSRKENIGASGCRCRCPSDHREIENSSGSCSSLWAKLTSDEKPSDKKILDLDRIEKQARYWFEEFVNDGGKAKNWKLTDDQINLLGSMFIV